MAEYNITQSFHVILEGRPKPKERPRLTIANLNLIAIHTYNLFRKTPNMSVASFKEAFVNIVRSINKGMGGRVYTPQATQNYEEYVGLLAKNIMRTKVNDNMINIEIKLYFADKKVGDVDNYTKSILDGLHTIMDNDKQVKRVVVEKFISFDENNNKIDKKQERAELTIDVLDLPIYYKRKE